MSVSVYNVSKCCNVAVDNQWTSSFGMSFCFYCWGREWVLCVCVHVYAQSAQLHPTLRYPMACSPPGSSVHGILQARILEWVAIFFSRGSSRPRDQTCVSCVGRWILDLCITWEAQGVSVIGE